MPGRRPLDGRHVAAMADGPPRMYGDLADWFHLIAPPADDVEEAALILDLLTRAVAANVSALRPSRSCPVTAAASAIPSCACSRAASLPARRSPSSRRRRSPPWEGDRS